MKSVCSFHKSTTRLIIVLIIISLLPITGYTAPNQKENHRPFVTHPSQLEDDTFAQWIIPEDELGVFLFRKSFSLEYKPEAFIVHVSADPRYQLFVNEQEVSFGPAVGDLENWHYESIDIAPQLRAGENIIAARVWNWGRLNGSRQITYKTAFILQGDSDSEQLVNTNSSWKVYNDKSYHPIEMTREIVGGNYIAGATDSIDGTKHPWKWKTKEFDDRNWKNAREFGRGNHTGLDTWRVTTWKLTRSSLLPMEQTKKPIGDVLQVKGMLTGPEGVTLPSIIPPNSHVEILLDKRYLTMGFPKLQVTGGEGSTIKIQYQEAMFNPDGSKGHRDHWEGKIMKGYYDVFIPDGGKRLFEPLWIRVFRYVTLTINTEDDPLTIDDFHYIFTAYPLHENAVFISSDPSLEPIWDASWRTARLCALENYMDCPYYEQLQYIGDTRIQSLISMYIDGDDRLARNALLQFYNSMQPMGLTKSVHPAGGVQIIPPFTLIYIAMVHDYYMLRDDPDFVRQFMPGVIFMLEWFISRIDDNGIMGPLPYWNHIDGGTDFINGSPPGISDGGSAHMTILLAYAIDHAVDMLKEFGYNCEAERFNSISVSLKAKIMALCYSEERGLIAETPDKTTFSQHTNIFAILTDTFNPEIQSAIAKKILTEQDLIQTTLYFKFYLFEALQKTGMGHRIIDLMEDWKVLIDHGFTTFPEHGIESRSDCHAWAAHPIYGLMSIVGGIRSASPGFKTVSIHPKPGALSDVFVEMPHPLGSITLQFNTINESEVNYSIILPYNLTGNFIHKGEQHPLQPGLNVFHLE